MVFIVMWQVTVPTGPEMEAHHQMRREYDAEIAGAIKAMTARDDLEPIVLDIEGKTPETLLQEAVNGVDSKSPLKDEVNDNYNNRRTDWGKSRFFTVPSQRREPSPTRMLKWPGLGEIACKSRETHRALITCNMSCVAWCDRTAQLSSLTGVK